MLSPTVISWIIVVLVLGFGGFIIYRDLKKPLPKQKMKSKIIHYSHNEKYACNEAIEPTEEKLSEDWKKVTCKNCQNTKFYY